LQKGWAAFPSSRTGMFGTDLTTLSQGVCKADHTDMLLDCCSHILLVGCGDHTAVPAGMQVTQLLKSHSHSLQRQFTLHASASTGHNLVL
jgi:hypothetical protein